MPWLEYLRDSLGYGFSYVGGLGLLLWVAAVGGTYRRARRASDRELA